MLYSCYLTRCSQSTRRITAVTEVLTCILVFCLMLPEYCFPDVIRINEQNRVFAVLLVFTSTFTPTKKIENNKTFL